ncbi:YjgF-like protein [Thelephora ganbajun]|uniref:YjgF-like protein n=1 Tax=Thelephora ganbajun TaxID=370292 RepID=A0ACB6ZT78_THEGA|nr:YjgF-like protein [Thelephora ganbajun]
MASSLMKSLDVSHESDSGDNKPQDEPVALRTLTYATSNPYELRFGYSRAVRKGPYIFVSGTTSIDPGAGHVRHPDSAYLQALVIFEEIINSIERLHGSKEDVARVRMFVTEQEDTEAVGKALKASLGDVRPAATMIVGARFVDKDMKVEIEADAVLLV